MPTAQTAQQTLRVLTKNWKSYFEAKKEYRLHPEDFTGEPRIPGYKPLGDTGYFSVYMTNQNCKLKDGHIKFPKVFNNFEVKTNVTSGFQQLRFKYDGNKIKIEVVYKIPDVINFVNTDVIAGCDLGINNLATIGLSNGGDGLIINGRPIKSINHLYNKELAQKKSILEHMNNRKKSNAITTLTRKRNHKITDYMHKASRLVVDYCVENNVGTLIVGENKGWKQNINLSYRVNQNFVQIPFNQFKGMLEYKAADVGIKVVFVEESYTSGTSFFDRELPLEEFYNKSRRQFRGLFKTNRGDLVNADYNAALQIIKKLHSDIYFEHIPSIHRYSCK